MRYPTLPRATTERALKSLINGEDIELDDQVKWQMAGDDVDLAPFAELSANIDAAVQELQGSDKDAIEGRFSVPLYRLVKDFPVAVIDDPDFWAFLGIRYFWNFVYWRQSKAFDEHEPAKYLRYADGRSFSECVLIRMYLRGKTVVEGGDPDLADSVTEATDFWRSHIIRVSTSYSPVLAAAVVRSQATSRLPTDPLRLFARRLNRQSANIVTCLLDESDADGFVERARNLESPG